MPTVELKLPKRHPAQQQIVQQHKRFNVIACGRRFGKTELGLDISTDEPRGLLDGMPVGWFAPNAKVFDEAWRHAVSALRPITKRVDSQKNRIELLTGGTFDFWTLHNTDDPARGYKYAKVIIDEAAIVPSERLRVQWTEAIRPTLTDLEGEAWFLSTPKGHGYFEELYQRGVEGGEWRSWRFPTTANPFINPDEVEAARLELPPHVFRQEYLAEFVHESGAVFKPPTYYDPGDLPTNGYQDASGCDFAYTSKQGDWTAFLRGRVKDGVIYLTNLYHERVESTVWAQFLRLEPSPFAYIGGQESGIAGFLRKDYGVNLRTERAVSDKLARAMPAVTAWNRGEIRLPAGAEMNTPIESELLAFTGDPRVDEHDDIVDALAALHHALMKHRADPATVRRSIGLR